MLSEQPHPIEREYAVALNLWGWICLLSRATVITFALLFKFVKAALGGEQRRNGHTLYKYIVYEGMRDYQYGLSAVGIQSLLPSTRWMCKQFAKSNRLPYAFIHLRDGTSVIHVGPKVGNPSGGSSDNPSTAKKAVIMIHGGGYMGPALGEHIHLACGFQKTILEGVSVYMLQYGLASETANHYPRQLQQATALLEYLLNSERFPPSAITLIGDSAGAHLALSLLLHLAHPNPDVPPIALNGQRLAGAALISPWIITPGRSEGLVKDNEVKDVLHAAALDYWSQNFLGGSKGDPWNCPLMTPGDWWADLPVDGLFVTYGENEVLRDNVAQFCSALLHARKAAGLAEKTTATGYPDEMHVHMVMNRFLKINEECKSEKDFCAWLKAQLTAPPPQVTDK